MNRISEPQATVELTRFMTDNLHNTETESQNHEHINDVLMSLNKAMVIQSEQVTKILAAIASLYIEEELHKKNKVNISGSELVIEELNKLLKRGRHSHLKTQERGSEQFFSQLREIALFVDEQTLTPEHEQKLKELKQELFNRTNHIVEYDFAIENKVPAAPEDTTEYNSNVVYFDGGDVDLSVYIASINEVLILNGLELEVFLAMAEALRLVLETMSDLLVGVQDALAEVRSQGKDDAEISIDDERLSWLTDPDFNIFEAAGFYVNDEGYPITDPNDPTSYIWKVEGAPGDYDEQMMAICDAINNIDVTSYSPGEMLLAEELDMLVSQLNAHIELINNEISQLLKEMETTTLTQYQNLIDTMREIVTDIIGLMTNAAGRI